MIQSPFENTAMETLRLTLSGKDRFPCAELFGRGVRLGVRAGGSVRELLCGQLGVAESYLDERIQTVFVNGRAVDDVNQSRVDVGDVLSLSAAMPGLVGATLRRGGHLAVLRKNISYAGSDTGDDRGGGTVTLKLFNMVARELGPRLLEHGVIAAGRDLSGPLKAAEPHVKAVERSGAPASMAELSDLLDSDREVLLRVEASR